MVLNSISTDRLILRPLILEDAPSIYSYAKHSIVAKHCLWDAHKSLKDSESFIKDYALVKYEYGEPEPFGICLKDDLSTVIGTIGCFWNTKNNQSLELAYALDPKHWGKGYIAEASVSLLDFAFKIFKLQRIVCRCKSENLASFKVMQKLGMTYEGTSRRSVINKGDVFDMKNCSLLASEWLDQKRGRETSFIRRAHLGDEMGIHESHMSSIQDICSSDYSPVQIDAWGRREFNYEARKNSILEDHVWVVEVKCQIVGYGQIHLKDSTAHLTGLYIEKEHTSKGFGKELIDTMIEYCRLESVQEIKLNSTITAKSFYERSGFSVCGPMEMGKIGGVSIEDFPMNLKL